MVCPVGAISEPAFQEAQKNPRFHGFAMPLQAATGPGFFLRPAAEFPVRIHFRLYQRKTSEWYNGSSTARRDLADPEFQTLKVENSETQNAEEVCWILKALEDAAWCGTSDPRYRPV